MPNNFKKEILLGITGEKEDWKEKLSDINKLGISEAALFLERFDETQRKNIYRELLDSTLKEIPLCHIKNDMEVEELVFMESKFKTDYFTIHENSFSFLEKWPTFHKKLYLEMDANDYVSQKVVLERIGGFCVDLSHFKMAQTLWSKEFEYTYFKKGKANFACNHINGYDEEKNTDLHVVNSLKDFAYLKTLPSFLFGKIIAIETDNPISDQIKFKNYLEKFFQS
ncbi:MAG: hypothetical protein PHF44_02405 [Candidatus Pacebacteria bacterium]|nr:hypothetical protein [Candidatus Paceibacterota bacterium]